MTIPGKMQQIGNDIKKGMFAEYYYYFIDYRRTTKLSRVLTN